MRALPSAARRPNSAPATLKAPIQHDALPHLLQSFCSNNLFPPTRFPWHELRERSKTSANTEDGCVIQCLLESKFTSLQRVGYNIPFRVRSARQSVESRIGLAQNCVSEAGNHSSALECAPQVILDVFFRKVVTDVVSHLQHPTKHFLCCETVERTRKALQASRILEALVLLAALAQHRGIVVTPILLGVRLSGQSTTATVRVLVDLGCNGRQLCNQGDRVVEGWLPVVGLIHSLLVSLCKDTGKLSSIVSTYSQNIASGNISDPVLPLGSCSWQSLMVRPWKRIPSFASSTDPSQIMAVRPLVALSLTRQTSLKQRSLPHATQGVLNFDATNALGCMALDLLEELAFGRDDLCEGVFEIGFRGCCEALFWPIWRQLAACLQSHQHIEYTRDAVLLLTLTLLRALRAERELLLHKLGRCGEDTSLQSWGESTSVGSFGYDAPGVMDLWPQYPHADGNKETYAWC
ncbi:hypothetical protein KCU83_g219, partial [Aureobasidium melanogenum]